MRIFRSRFRVAAPLEEVVAFHHRPSSLRAVTPPLIPMVFDPLPEEIDPGERMAFTLWLGPFPVRWVSELEALPEPEPGEEGFLDRQVEGPFRRWEHCHRFRADGEQESWVVDTIEVEFPPIRRHPWRFLVATQMWLGLPLLFAFRRWKTRRLLTPS